MSNYIFWLLFWLMVCVYICVDRICETIEKRTRSELFALAMMCIRGRK